MPLADPPAGARLALVIATSTYTDPGLSRLRAPATDATDLAAVLADPKSGGFAVTSVIDRTAQEIRLAVDDFLTDRGTQDLLLVYLSCHGLLDARRRLFFAATDTRKDRLGSTGVESGWLMDQLEHCRARRQVLILDSCFSGAFAHGAKGPPELRLKDRVLGEGRGRVVLTASAATEYSFEGQPTADASPAGSVFTAALVEGLRTGAADFDQDGHITVDDAYRYVFDQVQAAGAAQTPQRWLYGGEGTILLARNPTTPTPAPAPSLPESLQTGLDSAHPNIRIGALHELADWLTSTDPTRAAAARYHLQRVADTDSPRVADTARHFLTRAHLTTPDSSFPTAASPVTESKTPGPAPLPVAQNLPTGLVHTLTGHTSYVSAVAFSPDGRNLATASNDDTVRLWDLASGQTLRTLSRHTSSVYGVAFSPNGRLLATVSGDETVRLWDPASGQHLRALTGHTWSVHGVAFSPDGRLLATGSLDRTVRLWDPATGQNLRTLTGHTAQINGVAFSPNGHLLATASSDGTVRLWDPASGQHLRTLTGHTWSVHGVAFSPDGRLLATASLDRTVRLWDPASGQHLRTLTGHTSCVFGVAFSPDGRLLATASDDNTVRLWA